MNKLFKQIVSSIAIVALSVNTTWAAQQDIPRLMQSNNHRSTSADAVATTATKSAGIVLDPTVRADQTGIKKSSNGTQVIDIATPTAKGVSHNLFSEFNVDENGVIFNNSAAPVLTQLGGWSDGNRRLAGGEASIILSEVTGNNRSNLLGAIEIAGKSAEFILANANGITCNGCGFINTPRVSLITGKPNYDAQGRLGFDVGSGDFLLTGKGLNASNIDRFDIITRAAKINADLYANKLNITTGNNHVDYETGQVSQLSDSQSSVFFALDSTALGGMYANSIRLIGTEKGVGVNTEGLIQSITDLEISADGDIHIKNAIANNTLSMKSQSGAITTDNTIYGKNVSLNGLRDLTNNGLIAAQQVLDLSGKIFAQNGNVYAGLNSDGTLSTTGKLNAHFSDAINNQGTVYAASGLDLETTLLNNQQLWILGRANQLTGAQSIQNTGLIQFNGADTASIVTGHLDNSAGQIAHSGTGNLNIVSNDDVNNANGSISAAHGLQIAAQQLTNDQGTLKADNLNLQIQSINNSGGEIQSNQLVVAADTLDNSNGNIYALSSQENGLSLNVKNTLTNKNGLIYGNSNSVNINAGKIDNSNGYLIFNSNSALSLTSDTQLNNSNGIIQAGVSTLSLADLNNDQGKLFTKNLNLNAQTIQNNSGLMQTTSFTISADNYDSDTGILLATGADGQSNNLLLTDSLKNINSAVIQSNSGDFSVKALTVNNEKSVISHSGDGAFTLAAQDIFNSQGSLLAKNNLALTSTSLQNSDGLIRAGQIDLNATSLSNNEGVIQANLSTISLIADDLNNSAGIISAISNLDIHATTGINNNNGFISTTSQLKLTSQSLDNTQGEIYGDSVNLAVDHFNNKNGYLQAQQLHLTLPELDNSFGVLAAKGVFDITVLGDVNNTSGILYGAGDSFSLSAKNLINNQGEINYSGNQVANIQALAIDNAGGKIHSSGKLNLSTDSLENNAGIITSLDNLIVDVSNLLSNKSGKVQSDSNFTLTAHDILNNDGLLSANQLSISSNKIENTTTGTIEGINLNIHADEINNLGKISAVGSTQQSLIIDSRKLTNTGLLESFGVDLVLNNIDLNNSHGQIIHHGQGNLAIDTPATLDNSYSKLATEGSLIINAQAINNDNGELIANGGLSTSVNTLSNQHGLFEIGKSANLTIGALNNNFGEIIFSGNEDANLKSTGNINNDSGSILYTGTKNFNLIARNIINTNGSVGSQSDLSINAANQIDNTAGNIVGTGNANIGASNLLNVNAKIEANNLTIASNAINNAGGLLFSKGGADDSLKITSQALNNNSGVIESNGNTFSLIDSGLENKNGVITHHGSGQLLIKQSQLNNDASFIASNGSINLAIAQLKNINQTEITAANSLSITATDIINQASLLQAEHGLSLTATSLTNTDNAEILNIGSEQSIFKIDQLNNKAHISAVGDINIESKTLENSGLLATDGKLNIYNGDLLTNSGNITAKELILSISNIDNNASGNIGSTKLNIAADSLHNNGSIKVAGSDDLSEMNISDFINAGTFEAKNAKLTTSQLDNSGGTFIYNGAIPLVLNVTQFKNSNGFLSASTLAVTGQTLDNTNGKIVTDQLSSDVDQLININGHLQADQNFTLKAQTLDNSQNGHIISASTNASTIVAANLHNNSGVFAVDNITLTSASFNNDHGKITGTNLLLNADTIDNTSGLIATTSDSANGSLSVVANDAINNTDGIIQSQSKQFILAAKSINNQQGELGNYGDGTFSVNTIDLTNSSNASIYAKGDLQLVVKNLNNSLSLIQADRNLTFNSDNISNENGKILAANALDVTTKTFSNTTTDTNNVALVQGNKSTFNVTDLLQNSSNSRIESSRFSLIANQATLNNAGVILATNSDLFNIDLKSLSNSGTLQTDSNVFSLSATQLNNNGTINHLGNGNLSITTNGLDNSSGLIKTAGNLNLVAQANLLNLHGTITAEQGSLLINAGQIDNTTGVLKGKQSTLNANQNIINDAGEISADTLTVTANNFSNVHDGALLKANQINLITLQTFTNDQNAKVDADHLSITANDLNNLALIQAQQLSLSGQNLNNQGHLVALASSGDVFTTHFTNGITNANGVIESKSDQLTLTDNINNQNGTILLSGNGLLSVNTINNSQGQLLSNGSVQINGDTTNRSLNNQQGEIKAVDKLIINAATVDNTQGKLFAGNILRWQGTSLDNSNGGLVHSEGDNQNSLLLAGHVINNKGTIETYATNYNLQADSIDNQHGTFTHLGSGLLSITSNGVLENTAGTIQSNGDMNVLVSGTSGEIHNQGGLLKAKNITLSADALIDNSSAGVIEGASLNLTANQINNSFGHLIANATDFGTISLNSPNIINNSSGELRSGAKNWSLNLDLFNNLNGSIVHTGTGSLTIGSTHELDNAGVISSKSDLVVNTQGINNSGTLIADNNIQITSDGEVKNSTSGVIKAASLITIDTTNSDVINDGELNAGKNLNLRLINGSLTNSGKILTLTDSTSWDLKNFTNTGTVTASGSGLFTIIANAISNQNAIESVSGDIKLVAATINNSNKINANNLEFSGFNILTNDGSIEADKLTFTGTQLTNNSSISAIGTTDSLQLWVNQLSNNAGATLSTNSLNQQFHGAIVNAGTIEHTGTGTLSLGDAGSVQIDTNGKINTAGTALLTSGISGKGNLFAKQGINISGPGIFTNDGTTLYTEGAFNVVSGIDNKQQGQLIADGAFTIQTTDAVKNDSGTIQGQNSVINAGSISNVGGTINSLGTDSGSITAHTINNQSGHINASNSLFWVIADTDSIDNTAGHIVKQSTGLLTVNAGQNIVNAGGEIITDGQLVLTSGTKLDNGSGGLIQADWFKINTPTLNNSGKIISTGTTTNSIDATDLNNSNGQITSNNGDLRITASNNVDNSSGNIANAGAGTLTLNSKSLTTDSQSKILSNGDINLTLQTALNNNGEISSSVTNTINATGINNTGLIASQLGQVNLNLTGFTLSNTNNGGANSGQINSKEKLTINASKIYNDSKLQSGQDISITTNSFDKIGTIIANQTLSINLIDTLLLGEFDTIIAPHSLSITTQGGFYNSGKISATNDLSLTGNFLENYLTGSITGGLGNGSKLNISGDVSNWGVISSKSGLTIDSYNFNNNAGGSVVAGGNLSFNPNGHDFTNNNVIYSAGVLTIFNASNIYNNQNAILLSGQDMNLTASNSIVNTKARIESLGNMTLSATNLIKNDAESPTLAPQDITYSSAPEVYGGIQHNYDSFGGDMIIENTTGVDTKIVKSVYSSNADSKILASGSMSLLGGTTANIINNYGTISTGGNLILNGANLTNNSLADNTETTVTPYARHRMISCTWQTCPHGIDQKDYGTPVVTVQLDGGIVGSIHAAGNITGNLSDRLNFVSPINATVGGGFGATTSPSQNASLVGDGASTASQKDSNFNKTIQQGSNANTDQRNGISGVAGSGAVTSNGTNAQGGSGIGPSGLQLTTAQGLASIATNLAQLPSIQSALQQGQLQQLEKFDAAQLHQLALNGALDQLLAQFNLNPTGTSNSSSLNDPHNNLINILDQISSGVNPFTDEASLHAFIAALNGQLADKVNGIDASQTIAGQASGIPALLAKAKPQTGAAINVQPISFSVLPFNFDLSNLSGLYALAKSPNSHYLIETRPEFTNYQNFLGSDYLLNALGLDPDKTTKRLGDAFFENQLIRDALMSQANVHYLDGETNDYDQMQYLMNNAVEANENLQLTLGVELTPSQAASLTQDILWLVQKKVNGQMVLVPHLYLTSVSSEKLQASSAAIAAGGSIDLKAKSGIDTQGKLYAGNSLKLSTSGSFNQGGTVVARGDVRLIADQALSNKGYVQGQSVALQAGDNIINQGSVKASDNLTLTSLQNGITNSGKLISDNTLTLAAEKDIRNQQGLLEGKDVNLVSKTGDIINRTEFEKVTMVDNLKRTQVTTKVGDSSNIIAYNNLSMDAGKNIDLQGSQLSSGNDITLKAGNDVLLTAIEKATTVDNSTRKRTNKSTSTTYDAVSLNAGNDLSIQAGHDINAQGSQLTSGGNTVLIAGNDVNLTALANVNHSEDLAKKKKIIDTETTHTLVNINSGGSTSIKAGQDVNLTGTNVNAAGDIALAAARDTNISAVVDSDYHYDYTKKTKSFGRSKTTINETLDSKVVGGELTSGGDLLINAHKNADGEIVSQQSGNVNLVGTSLVAKGDAVITADDDINVTGIQHDILNYHATQKTGASLGKALGLQTPGLNISGSKKDKGNVKSNTLLDNAIIKAGGDAQLLSGNNLTIASTNVVTDGNINLEAVDKLLITAGDVISNSEQWNKKSGLFTGGNLYSKKEHKNGEGVTSTQASTLQAGGAVTGHAGEGQIIGSDVSGTQGVKIIGDAGDINIDAALTTTQSYSYDKTMSVGLGDAVKGLSRPDQMAKNKNGRATVKLADAQYDSIDTKTTTTDMRGSTLTSDNDVTLIASAGKVAVTGSTLVADADNNKSGTLGLAGATGVDIKEATNTSETITKETKGSAELSFVVQHQAVEVVTAAIAVDKAKEKLQDAKKDYKNYERNLDQLHSQLTQLESDYTNKVPGVQYDDVLELRNIIKDAEGDKEWYQAGIALAAVNLTSSITALAQQIAAAAQSAGTYGFNAGVQLDIDATKTNVSDKSTTAVASNLSGNNIVIQTGTLNADGSLDKAGTQTNIKGSHLSATDSINIQTGELNITNSIDTSEHKAEKEHGHVTAQMTVYGASGGASVTGSFDRSKNSDASTTINNSTLNADKISLESTGDTNIRGANVRAESELIVDVGGDLNVESQQNRSRSKNTSMGVSAGMSFGGTGENKNSTQNASDVGSASGVNGGLNTSNGMSVTKQTVLTSLTSGGTADINVKGNTQITGALIATVDDAGKDVGNLNLNTGSLSFTDLRNINVSNQTSAGISANFGLDGSKGDNTAGTAKDSNGNNLKAQTSNLTYENTSTNDASKSLATLGHGSITVGGTLLEQNGELTDAGKATTSSLIALNRDTANTDKKLWNSTQHQSVDATLDHRLLTEKGRNEIKEDVKRSEIGIIAIADLAGKDVSFTGDNADGKTSLRQNMINKQNYFDAAKAFSDPKNEQYIKDITYGVASPEAKQAAITAFANAIAAETGVSQVEALTLVQDHFNLNTRAYDGTNINQRITGAYAENPENGKGTIFSVDDNQATTTDMVDTLGHEMSHHMDASRDQGVIKTENYETNRDLYAERMGNALVDYTNFNFTKNGYNALGATNQHIGSTSDRGTIERNNAVFNSLDVNSIDYRNLHSLEIARIAETSEAFAITQGISPEKAQDILVNRALARVDTRYADVPKNEAADKWLDTMSVGLLRNPDGKYDVQMYSATEKQKNDHEMFAGMTASSSNVSNTQTTQFILGRGNIAENLEAFTRVTIAPEAFANNQYGNNDVVFGHDVGFISKDFVSTSPKAYGAETLDRNGIVDPTDLGRLNQFTPIVTGDVASLADYLGLGPNRVSSDRKYVNGQKEVFTAAVSLMSNGSSTPAILLSDNQTLYNQRNQNTQAALGEYLTQSEQEIVNKQVNNLQLGQTLDISTPLQISSIRATQNNENFLTGFSNDLHEQANTTSLIDAPLIHLDNVTVSFAEHIGKNWELFTTDNKAPAYMRSEAASGVVNDVITLATLFPTRSGLKAIKEIDSATSAANASKKLALAGNADTEMIGQFDTLYESTAARQSASYQGKAPYFGVDDLSNISLEKGTIIAHVTWKDAGGITGNYFTTPEAVELARGVDGAVNAKALNQSLQVYAGEGKSDYKKFVQLFEVNTDIPYGGAAFGATKANPQFNPGRYELSDQYFVLDKYKENLSEIPDTLEKMNNYKAPDLTEKLKKLREKNAKN